PTAQNRTCGFPAYGSHLGSKRQVVAACDPEGIFCDDISEFESYMPRQPVRSSPVLAGGPPKSAQIGPIRRIRPCAGSGNGGVISVLCLRGPFLVSRLRAMRLQR